MADALRHLKPLVRQAEMLADRYDAVVANPPYMGNKRMNSLVKKFAKDHFPDAKSDLFACFIERGYTLAKDAGYNAMVTMQSWMFLSSFEKMRERMLREKTIKSMAHLGARAFGSISGEVVQTTACVLQNRSPQRYKPVFFRLLDGSDEEKRTALASGDQRFDSTAQDELKKIPGSPVAYWVSDDLRNSFTEHKALHEFATPRAGMITGDNATFLRSWQEVSIDLVGWSCETRDEARISGRRWFPYQKGGKFRKWAGNREWIVNWEEDGLRLRTTKDSQGNIPAHAFNEEYIFRPNVNWSAISSSPFSARVISCGSLFDAAGSSAFPDDVESALYLAGFLNSKVSLLMFEAINPTLNFQAWNVGNLPLDTSLFGSREISTTLQSLHNLANLDWNSFEESWDFQSLPILTTSSEPAHILESSYTAWTNQNRETIAEMKRLEEKNNRLFIDAYDLQDELTSDVPIEQITLTVNPANRYGGDLTEEEQWARFRRDTMAELVSYAIGCVLGRYSLDAPGLIYAHSGGAGFDPSRYVTFPADSDGIIPITDGQWFDDDAAYRLTEFVSVAWDKTRLEDNLAFLAGSLHPRKNESSRETLRRYLCDSFFKDHLQTYKKRPIYWLFSSGKQKAFQCLVYLHRYNQGTLARMRTEYVIPLQGMMASRVRQLEGDIDAADSTVHRRRLEKERVYCWSRNNRSFGSLT